MRVYGNGIPSSFAVYHYGRSCEVRLWENVIQLEDNLYAYDEYSIKNLPEDETLDADVEARFDDWLATGRALERVPGSSEVYHLEQEHMDELGELVEIVYQDDLGVIG